jgi:anti-sigma factor RsiW
MFSLTDLMRRAMIRPATPERNWPVAGPCAEWELILHAFFDGELNAIDSSACEQHLSQCQACSAQVESLKSMRRKIKRAALRWPVPVASRCRSAL